MVNIIICTVNSYVLWDETSLTESLFNFDIGFDNNYMDINLERIFKFFFNLLSYLDSSNIKRPILCYYNYKDRFEMKRKTTSLLMKIVMRKFKENILIRISRCLKNV